MMTQHSDMEADQYRSVRDQLQWSQQALADALGVTIRTVQRREAGVVPILSEAILAMRYVCLKTLHFEPAELHGPKHRTDKQAHRPGI